MTGEHVVDVWLAIHRGGPCAGCVTACDPTPRSVGPGDTVAVPCPNRPDVVYRGGYDTINPDDPSQMFVYWPTPPEPMTVPNLERELAGTGGGAWSEDIARRLHPSRHR